MKPEEKDSLISRRLAKMSTPPPEAPKVPEEPARQKPPVPKRNVRQRELSSRKAFDSLYTKYLLAGVLAIMIFSSSGIYLVFASRITPEQQQRYGPLPNAESSSAAILPETASAAAAEMDSDQRYYEYARSISGREDPFEPLLTPPPELPPPPPPPAPKLFVSLLGTMTAEPRMAVLEVTKDGEKKRLKAKEGESKEGITVEKIEKGSVTLRNAYESIRIELGATGELRR